MSALSQIGKCAGRVNLDEGELLIAIRAYLDSSGKLENDYMTLAAMAATDSMWGEVETEWGRILSGHSPKATYVHRREICHQIEGFDRKFGWTNENAFGLSNKCLAYLSQLDKKRFSIFYCAIGGAHGHPRGAGVMWGDSRFAD